MAGSLHSVLVVDPADLVARVGPPATGAVLAGQGAAGSDARLSALVFPRAVAEEAAVFSGPQLAG